VIRKEYRVVWKKGTGIMKNSEDEFKVVFLVFLIYVLYVVRFLVEVCLS
jgi:hypothetical protein